jgi:energy-converting hydrogenase Eha subunit A
MNIRLSLLEIFLLELVFWLGLWLSNDYLATLLTLSIGAIILSVLIIALAAEAIERSKVPRKYFWVMAISLLAPILAAGIYALLFGGKLNFMERPF